MDLAPANPVRPSSVWQERDSPQLVVGRRDELPHAKPLVQTVMLADPPWPDDALAPEPEPPLESDERPAPPTTGVPQLCTTVQLVGGGDDYRVVLDGVQVGAVSLADAAKVDRFWLPRYRERKSLPTSTRAERRLAAPVCIGVRVDEATAPPLRCTLRVRQRVWDRGTVVMSDEDTVTQQEKLVPHGASDREAEYVLLPYPACITTPPHVTIYDCDRLRRWEAQRRKWTNNRFWDVAKNIAKTASAEAGALSVTSALWTAVGNRKSGDNWYRSVWQALGMLASPRLRAAVQSMLSVKQLVWDGYEAQSDPPKEMRTHRYGVDELADALETIAETRADGKRNDRHWGLSPGEMESMQMQKESALFYWLLYGQKSVLTNGNLKRLADPMDRGGSWFTALKSRRSWAVFFNSQQLITGNFLNPRGLDPLVLRQTRLDLVYDLEIESYGPDGAVRTKRVQFEPLLANALDAGYLLQNLEGQMERLKRAVQNVKSKLASMRAYGYNWLHGRLLVSDTTKQGLFGGLNQFWPTGTVLDPQLREQWARLTTEQRSAKLKNTPLTIDLTGLGERLGRLVGEVAVPNPAARRKANLGKVLGGGGLVYRRRLGRLFELHRLSLGVGEGDYFRGNPKETLNFWRWVQHQVPILGPGQDERLHAFIVPLPVAAWVSQAPALVQRLPQLGLAAQWLSSTFGRTSLLVVKPLSYDDPHSDRALAKAAVDAARNCWRDTTEDYQRLQWSVEAESPGPVRYPLPFHYVECYDELPAEDADAYAALRPVRRADAAVDVLCMHAAGPEGLLHLERRNRMGGRSDEAWGRKAAAGGARHGDGAIAMAYGLEPTRESLAALDAFAAILVHRIVAHNTTLTRLDLVQTAVAEAQRAASEVAGIAQMLYGGKARRSCLVSRDDWFFECLPNTNYARLALSPIGEWMAAQRNMAVGAAGDFRNEWPAPARESIDAFASALRSVANSKVSPTALGPMALQSLWFALNPTVERLLSKRGGNERASGVQLQIRAAATAYRRVRVALAESGPVREASVAALSCVLASRPVTFTSVAVEARMLAALTATEARSNPLPQPREPRAHLEALRVRCGVLRIDLPLKEGDEPALLRAGETTALDLARRMSGLALDNTAVYLVPPGALWQQRATPMDMAHSSAWEDAPVWLEALHESALALVLIDAGATRLYPPARSRAVSITGDTAGTSHPQILRRSSEGVWVLALTRVPSLDEELAAPPTDGAELPRGLLDMQERLHSREQAGRDSPTWSLRERYRALMWNADRLMQLALLLTLHEPDRPTTTTLLQVPEDWDRAAVSALAASAALASAALRYSYPVTATIALAMPEGVGTGAVREALGPLVLATSAAATEGVAAMPLSEIALVTAAVLT